MRIQISECEFWMLTAMVDYSWPRRLLVDNPFDNLRMVVNLRIPEACGSIRNNVVDSLIEKRLIKIWKVNVFSSDFKIVKSEKRHELGLSQLGGRVWEKVSNANWNMYFEFMESYRRGRPTKAIITSTNQELVADFYSYVDGVEFDSIPGTEGYVYLPFWKPNYWKCLKDATRLLIDVIDKDPTTYDLDGRDQFEEWYQVPRDFPVVVDI